MKLMKKVWLIDLLELKRTTQFKKDLKRIIRRKLPIDLLDDIVLTLRKQKPLNPKHNDHALTGNFKDFRECHILPDWLLIYKIEKNNLILTVSRTGSHSDLFE
ncbi:MAG: type II toxin-antitoxin system YafQ family toxin [Oscillospiraceae bacterium]|nr:type II toxin-antitoxin system YafQ family toxin [Oscillospiraceae bacterium]